MDPKTLKTKNKKNGFWNPKGVERSRRLSLRSDTTLGDWILPEELSKNIEEGK